MIEILTGTKFENAVKELNLTANKTYKNDNLGYEIWEISDESLDKINTMPNEDWKDEEYGWYRYSTGSNIEEEDIRTIIINEKPIRAWINDVEFEDYLEYAYEDAEEAYDMGDIDHFPTDEEFKEIFVKERSKYKNLTDYLCDMLGVSQVHNTLHITIDLAKLNNMTLAELWSNYQV